MTEEISDIGPIYFVAMKKKDLSFQDLIEEAVENAREDRARAKDAYDKMKGIFDVVDPQDPSTLNTIMLAGAQTVKLIETIADSNEQVLKAAALKQKKDSKVEDDDQNDGPFDPDKIREEARKGLQ
jgi:hypothetical protein